MKEQGAVSSLVWLVASDVKHGKGGNIIHVIDAGKPNHSIDRFYVGNRDSNIICITAVPGWLIIANL